MIDALLSPLQVLGEHFAWPWLLLALPLPWLARALLSPPSLDAGGFLMSPR